MDLVSYRNFLSLQFEGVYINNAESKHTWKTELVFLILQEEILNTQTHI